MEATAQWAQAKVYPQDGTYPASLDALLREPYRSLITQPPLSTDARSYGSFIFATFLQQKVANSETIVRQTWERYRANNGGSMLTAIDQVLQNQYATNLANEFPKFTWHNYFLNNGTYDVQATNVYTNLATLTPSFTGPEWQLFRSHLQHPRNDWDGRDPRSNGIANAGVRADPVTVYPRSGPSVDYSPVAGPLGAAHVEFLRPSAISTNAALSVTLSIFLPRADPAGFIRTSVLPITNFGTLPHPGNQFLPPVPVSGEFTPIYRQTFRVAKFDQCNRVAVIVNNVHRLDTFRYEYIAELIPPLSTPTTPCTLVFP